MFTAYNYRGDRVKTFERAQEIIPYVKLNMEYKDIVQDLISNRMLDTGELLIFAEDPQGYLHRWSKEEIGDANAHQQVKLAHSHFEEILAAEAYFHARNARVVEDSTHKDYLRTGLARVVEEDTAREAQNVQDMFTSELNGQDGGVYTANGSSAHYKKAVLEYIDKQERAYGTFLAYALCFMQVDKYRDRAGHKAGVPIEKDMVKAQWYESCAQYLKEKLELSPNDQARVIRFQEKYGGGRSDHIPMPYVLRRLLGQDILNSDDSPYQTLGQIVDNIQEATGG